MILSADERLKCFETRKRLVLEVMLQFRLL